MLKKLLPLTMALVMLSMTAFANPNGGIDAYAEYLYAVSVAVDADSAAIDENGLGGNVTLELAADEDNSAIIVTAVFDGNEFLTASITRDVALTADATTRKPSHFPPRKQMRTTATQLNFTFGKLLLLSLFQHLR